MDCDASVMRAGLADGNDAVMVVVVVTTVVMV